MTESKLCNNYSTSYCLIIIDSDSVFTARFMSMFESQYRCEIASTGESGLDLFDELSYLKRLLVVCGSDLPDMSALDVCSMIKKVAPETFVALLSEDNDAETRMSGLIAGADNCLDKSVSDEELELLVSNVLHTLSVLTVSDDEAQNVDTINDELFCALEIEVRLSIESYYQLPLDKRQEEECSSKSIAERLGLSQRTFQRAMRSETGYTFKQLQLIVRLEEAQKLLAEGYNENQVTDLLSFSSPAHLSSAFKDEFGVRPSKYRRLVDGA
jgi:AraC-like DNA-binding protein